MTEEASAIVIGNVVGVCKNLAKKAIEDTNLRYKAPKQKSIWASHMIAPGVWTLTGRELRIYAGGECVLSQSEKPAESPVPLIIDGPWIEAVLAAYEPIRRRKMCVNKRVYEAEEAAKFFGSTFFQRAYECPYCKKWHLTTKHVTGEDKDYKIA